MNHNVSCRIPICNIVKKYALAFELGFLINIVLDEGTGGFPLLFSEPVIQKTSVISGILINFQYIFVMNC